MIFKGLNIILVLKDNCTEYTVLGGQLYSFCASSSEFYCFCLTSALRHNIVPLKVPSTFKLFSFYLVFSSLTMIWLNVVFFVSIMIEFSELDLSYNIFNQFQKFLSIPFQILLLLYSFVQCLQLHLSLFTVSHLVLYFFLYFSYFFSLCL